MKVEILVGPVASGKGTYCKQAAEDGAVIVNDDSIVNSIHAGNYLLYDEDLKPLYKATENTIIQTALAMGRNVVIDRPNHSIAMRRRYIGLGHSFDAKVDIIMFDREEPIVHAKRRFASDSRGHTLEYWLKAIQRHEALYDPPDQDVEHFDKILHWDFNSETPRDK